MDRYLGVEVVVDAIAVAENQVLYRIEVALLGLLNLGKKGLEFSFWQVVERGAAIENDVVD